MWSPSLQSSEKQWKWCVGCCTVHAAISHSMPSHVHLCVCVFVSLLSCLFL